MVAEFPLITLYVTSVVSIFILDVVRARYAAAFIVFFILTSVFGTLSYQAKLLDEVFENFAEAAMREFNTTDIAWPRVCTFCKSFRGAPAIIFAYSSIFTAVSIIILALNQFAALNMTAICAIMYFSTHNNRIFWVVICRGRLLEERICRTIREPVSNTQYVDSPTQSANSASSIDL